MTNTFVPPPSTRGDDEDEHVFVCSGNGNVSKAHQLVQLNAGSSRGKTKENRRGTLPTTCQKLVVRKCWKEDEGGKERYLQVILTEWISKQYLQVHVGD